jgi:CDP-glycerol glycerophosphotransferase (TagB/SpsB family)
VLVCTSDARETLKRDDRATFLARCVELAAGRQLVFKLHPNENEERASREIRAVAPAALVFARGSAEEMIANCDVLVTQYSSTVFVGLALGKECHSYWDLAQLRRLMPVQNGSAARNVARVARELLAERPQEAVRPAAALAFEEVS